MSWLDPNWKYHPAATHGDPALFAQRQRERLQASNADTKWILTEKGAAAVIAMYKVGGSRDLSR